MSTLPKSEKDLTVVLCPGQGAQAPGMGRAWAEASAEARAVFERADAKLGFALSELCFRGEADELQRTDRAQLAIYACSVACYAGWREAGGLAEGAAYASGGLSLGEFTALHLAGAFSFEDGLELVRLRGEAMQDAAEASEGSMVAITGDVDEATAVAICEACAKDDVLVPANYNSPQQVVLSGSVAACERAAEEAGKRGLRATLLSVAGAFHSPLMKPAADRLGEALAATDFGTPRVPVLSNVTGEPHGDDVETIRRRLVEQLTQPVRWSQSVQWAACGAGESAEAAWPGRYVELGPGRVLGGLMRRTCKGVKVENLAEPASA